MEITESDFTCIKDFLKKNKKADLVTTYSYYIGERFKLSPVVYIPKKKIYKSFDDLVEVLKRDEELFRETRIKIRVGKQSVDKETKRVYICPYSGKVFGDNTHPNAQDAIYEWVSKCPENKERKNGVRVKKFYVSEDPKIISRYIKGVGKPLEKVVYTSWSTGKLFDDKESLMEDIKTRVKPIAMSDIPKQNQFEIESGFLEFIGEHLEESKVSDFVSELSNTPDFSSHVKRWLEA